MTHDVEHLKGRHFCSKLMDLDADHINIVFRQALEQPPETR